MNTMNRKNGQMRIPLVVIASSFVIAALPSISHADAWELRMVAKKVPGTREIESGKPEKAIRISKIQLGVTPSRLKSAVLTNLCIGHILIKDLEQAEKYCDDAAARQDNRTVTFNNRGVLRALQGDYTAAKNDFTIAANAGCFNGCDPTIRVRENLPRPAARRNFKRAETGVLASAKAKQAHQVVVQAEK